MIGLALAAAEYGLLPDAAIRFGIRQLLKSRLSSYSDGESERFTSSLASAPIALRSDKANEQHYELPPEFFSLVLGPNRKYSSGSWEHSDSLASSELEMLELTASRAKIVDGMRILDLGCGWGSFLLFAAQKFPNSEVVGVSNSNAQREFILNQAKERGLSRVSVLTADMNSFEAPGTFDRIVSVEMFEHMRNFPALFARVASWLKPEGMFFLHIFTHRKWSYPFEEDGEDNWMGRYFFTGGMMPAHDLPRKFSEHIRLVDYWKVSGVHYAKTCEAWLAKQDSESNRVREIFKQTYPRDRTRWFNRWRLFFLACSELFAFSGGEEWFVSHYLFRKNISGNSIS